ncbi:MAG: TPM domain-containing protein [Candidatus Adlerbacteria bacterium]
MVRACAKLFDRILTNRKKFHFGIIGVLLCSFATPAFAYTSPGNPSGYVNDFAHVLKAETVQVLDAQLKNFEASTSNQIAVVTVPNMQGDYVENYAVQLYKEWGIGTKEKDNGVLLLLSVEEHKIRIEVGYGLEGALPDSVAARIIANDLTPNLKAGNYDAGVATAVGDIILATQNEYTGTGGAGPGFSVTAHGIEIAFAVLFFALQWLAAIFARSKSWWAGGVVGGVLGAGVWAVLGFAVLWGALLTAVLVGLGLLFDYLVSKHYNAAKSTGAIIPWWIGGGGSGGGGGFGGFGGGRSGGGGASGGW